MSCEDSLRVEKGVFNGELAEAMFKFGSGVRGGGISIFGRPREVLHSRYPLLLRGRSGKSLEEVGDANDEGRPSPRGGKCSLNTLVKSSSSDPETLADSFDLLRVLEDLGGKAKLACFAVWRSSTLHSGSKPRLRAARSRDDGEGGEGLGVPGKPLTGMAGGRNNSGSDTESSSNRPRSEVGRRPGTRGLTVEGEGNELSDPGSRNRSWSAERLSLADRPRTVSNSQGFSSPIALCGCILYVELSKACDIS